MEKVVYSEDKEKLEKTRSVLWNGESVEQEYRIVHQQNGTVRWVLEQAFPVFGEAGNVAMISGIITDITKIKKWTSSCCWQKKYMNIRSRRY